MCSDANGRLGGVLWPGRCLAGHPRIGMPRKKPTTEALEQAAEASAAADLEAISEGVGQIAKTDPDIRAMFRIQKHGNSAEPDLPCRLKASKQSPLQADRDLFIYGVVSRMLVMGKEEDEIVEVVKGFGRRKITVAALRKMTDRTDFREYYRMYRERLYGGIDKKMRMEFKRFIPEAMTTAVKTMRSAMKHTMQGVKVPDEKLRFEASKFILEGSGTVSRKGDRGAKRPPSQVPVQLQVNLITEAKRLQGGNGNKPAALPAPPQPVEGETLESTDESAAPVRGSES